MNPKLRLSSITVGLMLAAFLAISVARAPGASAGALQQTDAPLDGPHVLITGNINVRGGPGTGFTIVAVARPGQRYTITGQNADGTWWRIDYLGEEGWLYAPLVQAVDAADVPVVEPAAPAEAVAPTPVPQETAAPETDEQASDQATVAILRAMNVRSGPGTSYRILAVARPGQRYAVTGQDAAGAWWRIDLDGQPAWVYASLVRAENSAGVPVVDAPPGDSGASAPGGNASAAASSPPAAAPAATRFDPAQVHLRLEPVLSGLNQPTYVTQAGDGSGRFFVVERPGRIRVFPGPHSQGQVFLDIADRVDDSGGEQGLLGLAFPPNFGATGYFFVNYTNNDGDTVVARYRVSDDPNQADRESEFVVLFQDQPAPNHNGGMLLFGPDGRLWIGLGDGGGANDTFQNGQNRGTLLGSMVRLDVTSDPSVPYRIPPDNPYAGDDDTADEIWAIGLRNPWRYSFDSRTGDLWIGDVGQSLFEEINYVPAAQVRQGGLNFGWPISEGMHCAGNAECDLGAFTLPIHEYGHAGNGCSVTGGRVYRGAAFPVLDGVYFFADFCSGNIWALWRTAGGETRTALVLPKAASITSFGVDEAGELYVTDFGGAVHRLVVAE